jgi:hypothetical protein
MRVFFSLTHAMLQMPGFRHKPKNISQNMAGRGSDFETKAPDSQRSFLFMLLEQGG